MNRLIQLKKTTPLFLITLAVLHFGLLPKVQAVLPSPTPDGAYPLGNTAEGLRALFSVTTGDNNTAVGFFSLFSNTTGHSNTAVGSATLSDNTTGARNTATGRSALENNTTGSANTADGFYALQRNTMGEFNTANGYLALFMNTTGRNNTAIGSVAIQSNTTGSNNTASGTGALESNTTGRNNTASGAIALSSNTTGHENTADGVGALSHNTTGSSNIALGPGAGSNLTTGNRNIDIGNDGVAGEEATIRIGTAVEQTKTFIAGINGAAVTGASVFVNNGGQLGTAVSSRRFKEEVEPMNKASEALFALEPVTFRYKKEIDPVGTEQFGLVAEDVEKVNPDLVIRDKEGKPYSVRYDQVNAMLLNEFLKEHKTVQEQGATITRQRRDFEAAIAQQQKEIEALTATVKQQAAQIDKVSAQLEVSERAPQTVLNSQ